MVGFNSPQQNNVKYAIRKLVRGPDGTLKVFYIDAATGQQLSNLQGYSLIESGRLMEGVSDSQDKQNENLGSQVAQSIVPNSGFMSVTGLGSGSDSGVREVQSESRNPQNNYNYIDKPRGLGLTSFLPGGLGMMGKAANMMINANNIQARNTVQTQLGLNPETGVKSTLKGLAKDPGPYIADLKYGKEGNQRITPVGFEAQLPDGRTTLTPEEARKRVLTDNTASVEVNVPEPSGLASHIKEGAKSLFDSASSVFDTIFDFGGTRGQIEDIARGQTSSNQYSLTDFPDAPPAPPQTSYGDQGGNTQQDYGSNQSYQESISPAASQAISEGKGGLW